jgi:hypothetical protein
VTYSPAPAGGRKNFPLRNPELYDVVADVDESYNIAAEHPDVVKEIQARIERLMTTFPPEIQKAWAEDKARPSGNSPAGAVARPAAQERK